MTFADIRWDLFLGGLGLFLFGIVLMGDGLKSAAGDKLRNYIDKYASKSWQGLIIGTVVTAVIQSSSATTAICIGFIRAGLMTFEQSAGIIIGANIGTTITAFLIGLNVEAIAPYLIFIGSMTLMFVNRKNLLDYARIFIGFGILFYSLSVMSDTLSMLKEVPQFMEFAQACTYNPLIGLVGGTIMTMAMQSSSASIGIIQLFYESGAMTFRGVIPFLFSANIGTTITAVLASIGGKVSAIRAALFHTVFNVIGTIIGFIFMTPLYNFIMFLANDYGVQPMMQIAITHILFNIAATIVVFPFIKQICWFIRKVVKGEEPKRLEINIEELDPKSFPVVSTALSVALKSLIQLKDVVKTNLNNTYLYINSTEDSDEDFDHIKETENVINKLDHSITHFLTNLPVDQMSEDGAEDTTLYLEVAKNLERIGDLSVNIAEFAKMVHEDSDRFSPSAYEEINSMYEYLFIMLDEAFEFLESRDIEIYEKIITQESKLDTIEYESRKKHFKRLVNKECAGAVASSIYADVLGNLERIGDHCCNIARYSFENTK